MPALAHKTSIRPFLAAATASALSMLASEVTSPTTPKAPWPISAAAASAWSGWRATIATLAPESANTRAMPLPMPFDPPVTTTDRPFKDWVMT